jgi:hypothetical protein
MYISILPQITNYPPRAPMMKICLALACFAGVSAFQTPLSDVVGSRRQSQSSVTTTTQLHDVSRRDLFVGAMGASLIALAPPQPAQAIGPVKVNLLNPRYKASPCPPDKPIPGEKAMKGMRGLCVNVEVDLENSPERALDKAGIYGFVTDQATGESVLANNPDLSTDAGQFAIVPEVKVTDKKIQFEFIAAVPQEVNPANYEFGIPPLDFKSLRVISFPGGQQYGAVNPCEMNEFSDECEAWEAENGPYERGEFMVKSNPRTKGR